MRDSGKYKGIPYHNFEQLQYLKDMDKSGGPQELPFGGLESRVVDAPLDPMDDYPKPYSLAEERAAQRLGNNGYRQKDFQEGSVQLPGSFDRKPVAQNFERGGNVRSLDDYRDKKNSNPDASVPGSQISMMPKTSQDQDQFSDVLGYAGTAAALATPFIPYAGVASAMLSIGKGLYDKKAANSRKEKIDNDAKIYRKLQNLNEEDLEGRYMARRRGF